MHGQWLHCHVVCSRGFNLVVIAAAQVTLSNAHFQDMGSCIAQLSVCADGVDTKVVVKGGTIIGGTHGASDLTITDVEVPGVEVKDEGSSIKLARCNLHEISSRYEQLATWVHESSSTHLSNVSITGMCFGVLVIHASAELVQCNVSDSLRDCIRFRSASGKLDPCTLSGSKSSHGLCVIGAGSCVHAAQCHFLGNTEQCGATARGGGRLTADACMSSDNRVGYSACREGSVLVLTNCSSTCDGSGCVVQLAGKLTANHVLFTECGLSGCTVASVGSAELWDCRAENCGDHGVWAQEERSRVEMEHCTLQNIGKYGVFAHNKAMVQSRDCRFSSRTFSFKSQYWASVELDLNSTSRW